MGRAYYRYTWGAFGNQSARLADRIGSVSHLDRKIGTKRACIETFRSFFLIMFLSILTFRSREQNALARVSLDCVPPLSHALAIGLFCTYLFYAKLKWVALRLRKSLKHIFIYRFIYIFKNVLLGYRIQSYSRTIY